MIGLSDSADPVVTVALDPTEEGAVAIDLSSDENFADEDAQPETIELVYPLHSSTVSTAALSTPVRADSGVCDKLACPDTELLTNTDPRSSNQWQGLKLSRLDWSQLSTDCSRELTYNLHNARDRVIKTAEGK